MNAFQVMVRYRKEVLQVSTLKNDIKVSYLNDTGIIKLGESQPIVPRTVSELLKSDEEKLLAVFFG